MAVDPRQAKPNPTVETFITTANFDFAQGLDERWSRHEFGVTFAPFHNGGLMLTDNILHLIGNSPLPHVQGERIFATPEFFNPGGSIKDRVALSMIEGAERDGRLKPDSITSSS